MNVTHMAKVTLQMWLSILRWGDYPCDCQKCPYRKKTEGDLTTKTEKKVM